MPWPAPLTAALVTAMPPRGVAIERLVKDALVAASLPDATGADNAFRLAAWRCLLGVPAALDEVAVSGRISRVNLDLPNQRVVTMDALRTRQEVAEFKEAAMVERIARLLTFYAKEGYACEESGSIGGDAAPPHVRYKQGINEVVAPFLMLSRPPGRISDGVVMALAARALARFAPRVFASNSDEESLSLQASLRLFRLLLQYHDPPICAVLDQFDVVPELYATPWFLTLFARGHDAAVLFPLWDFLFSCVRQPGPAILHCLAVALLQQNRAIVLDALRGGSAAADLPITLTQLSFETPARVRAACARALDLWADTPLTFRRLLHNVSYSGGPSGGGNGRTRRRTPIPVSSVLLARLEARISVKISVEELLIGAASRFTTRVAEHESLSLLQQRQQLSRGAAGGPQANEQEQGTQSTPAPTGWARLLHEDELESPPRYFLLDCRPRAEFEYGGRLPTAFHVDPQLLHDPEGLDALLESFAALRGTIHFAVLGCGDVTTWYHAPVGAPLLATAASTARLSPGSASGIAGADSPTAPRDTTPQTPVADAVHRPSGLSPSPPPARSDGFIENSSRAVIKSDLSSSGAAMSFREAASTGAAVSPQEYRPTTVSSLSLDVDEGRDDEYIAMRSGLDPLSATEDADYGAHDATRALLLLLLQRGFPFVSEVEGGFTALHQHQALFLDTTLVGHTRDLCMVCTGGAAAAALTELAERGGAVEGLQHDDGRRWTSGGRQSRGDSASLPGSSGGTVAARNADDSASQRTAAAASLSLVNQLSAATPAVASAVTSMSASVVSRGVGAVASWFSVPPSGSAAAIAASLGSAYAAQLSDARNAEGNVGAEATRLPAAISDHSGHASAGGWLPGTVDATAPAAGVPASRGVSSTMPLSKHELERRRLGGIVEGFDPALGLPIYTEPTLLDMQLDAIERRHGLHKSQIDRDSKRGAADARSAHAAISSHAPESRPGNDVSSDALTATARRIASAARTSLKSVADDATHAAARAAAKAWSGVGVAAAGAAEVLHAAATVVTSPPAIHERRRAQQLDHGYEATAAILASLPPPPSALPPPPSMIDQIDGMSRAGSRAGSLV